MIKDKYINYNEFELEVKKSFEQNFMTKRFQELFNQLIYNVIIKIKLDKFHSISDMLLFVELNVKEKWKNYSPSDIKPELYYIEVIKRYISKGLRNPHLIENYKRKILNKKLNKVKSL